MCGIVGYSSTCPKESDFDILQKIILQSKIRGLHSFGYSYYDNNVLKTIKKHTINQIKLPITNKLIFHNRYSTSGDYKNHNNNQPIDLISISLVFNGVIDMRTKEEMQEHYNITMTTDNDGEIPLQLYGSDYKKIAEFIKNIKGSFAGLMLTQNKLLAIRNANRPAWVLKLDDSIFIASTKDIFKRVNQDFEPTELESNKLYEY